MSRKHTTLASRLKSQLVLEAETLTADGLGGYTRAFEEVATLWAEITPLSGKEARFAEQLFTTSRFRIILRYRGDITASMRLRDDEKNRLFNIRSIMNVMEEHQMIEIIADEVKPAEFLGA